MKLVGPFDLTLGYDGLLHVRYRVTWKAACKVDLPTAIWRAYNTRHPAFREMCDTLRWEDMR